MKWVKCVYNGSGRIKDKLTIGKIYEVLEWVYIKTYTDNIQQTDSIKISIITDNGEKGSFFMIGAFCAWFEDATDEIRDNKINELLK